jgi:YHS domain-containing protein
MEMTMHTRRSVLIGTLSSAAIAGASGQALAAPGVFIKDGFALGGYDSTAYWTVNKAAMGKPPFSFQWAGGNWLFATQANRDAFAAEPERFAPAFNGYCPFCLTGGKLVPGLGDIFAMHKGKLYLLISQRVKDEFVMKADYYVERATTYWAKLS